MQYSLDAESSLFGTFPSHPVSRPYQQYDLFVHRIKYTVEEESRAVVVATQNLAKTFSGAAASSNSSFPLVSVPLFEITGYTARGESGIDMAAYTPIVTELERAAWQEYALAEMGWISTSRAFLAGKGEDPGITGSTNTAVKPFVWQHDELGNEVPAFPSPYLPMWQVRVDKTCDIVYLCDAECTDDLSICV